MEHAPDTRVGTPHYIYVITDGTDFAVKVGFASNPKKRLEAIQTGNPRELWFHRLYETDTRANACLLERAVHLHLQGQALMGEWFAATPEAADKQILDRAAAIHIQITLVEKAVNRRRKGLRPSKPESHNTGTPPQTLS